MSTPPPSQSILDNPLVSQWLDFGREGVVRLCSGKVEIGQGITTALVQIAADELDVAPGRIEVVSGDTRAGPVEAATTSSLSIQVGGSAVRLAASAARRLLLAEAGKLLQATDGALGVEDGLVHVDGRASDLTYWSLASDVDLGVPVADHAGPKKLADRRLIGTSLARIDLPEKAAGPAFIHDIVLDGMLHGRVLQPPSPWRRLAEIDTAALSDLGEGIEIVRDGSFLGVVAAREEEAVRAIERAAELAVWTKGEPAPADPVAAIAETNAAPEIIHAAGDTTDVEGRRIATAVSRPFIAHASAAPSCAIATWRDGWLEVRCHSQAVYGVRDALAVVFGIGAEAVDVIHMPGAGCYGHNGQDDVALDAALLAHAVPGRPVRVLWSRADELSVAPMGPAMATRAEAKVDVAGHILALTVD
ncbi:MAG: molybdopterin cofactor-binding domain-containing protein, partial [Methyloligellaceae bacterium]